MTTLPRLACVAVLGLAACGWVGDAAAQQDPWPELANQVFNGRPLVDGTDLLAIEMPGRAEDAAIVPLTVRATLPPGDARRVKAFTIVIDENPAPVTATFTIGPTAVVSSISTRVRVNSYTNVHAVAELSDGMLYAVRTYVKASGGCSAPASKSADEAKAGLGQLRLRQFTRAADSRASNLRDAQLMIRHPNNSGLQRDQLPRIEPAQIPARRAGNQRLARFGGHRQGSILERLGAADQLIERIMIEPAQDQDLAARQ